MLSKHLNEKHGIIDLYQQQIDFWSEVGAFHEYQKLLLNIVLVGTENANFRICEKKGWLSLQ